MFNPLGIENLKVSERGTQIPAFMRESSPSILNFDDILNSRLNPTPENNNNKYTVEKPLTYEEMNNARKGNDDTIENQQNSVVKKEEPKNFTHGKTDKIRENADVETKSFKEKNIISKKEKDVKNAKIESKNEDQLITDNIKLLNNEIRILLDLLKGLHGKDKKTRFNLKDLGASLKELRELLKSGVRDNIDNKLNLKQLFAKLEHIFGKLEKG